MYGGLQGLNKSETAAKHGEEQVKVKIIFKSKIRKKYLCFFQTWRRAYDIPPPLMDANDPELPEKDPKYAVISISFVYLKIYFNFFQDYDKSVLPRTECLKDTVERFLPFWHDSVVPQIKNGKRVLIAAHGNSIRALVKYLDNVPDNKIVELNIPTGNFRQFIYCFLD